MNAPQPLIAISLGDPAGIGPEVVCQALADDSILSLARWIVVGDAWLVEQTAAELQIDIQSWERPSAPNVDSAARVQLWDLNQLAPQDHVVGQVAPACGQAAIAYVEAATRLCLRRQTAAMVTAPICKEAIALAGRPDFCGHTEFIGQLCGVASPRLMLYNRQVCVVHASTHCSLVNATQLTTDQVFDTIRWGHQALQKLGCARPRVAVCGLNPHAGEHGLFGSEEATVIAPAIAQARAAGIECSDPLPADTVFYRAVRGDEFDLIVAMYHDQGHVPMKLLDFEHTVNVTLGIPIVRTSVDHGTAFDIAGKQQASCTNMLEAMRLAVRLAAL